MVCSSPDTTTAFGKADAVPPDSFVRSPGAALCCARVVLSEDGVSCTMSSASSPGGVKSEDRGRGSVRSLCALGRPFDARDRMVEAGV